MTDYKQARAVARYALLLAMAAFAAPPASAQTAACQKQAATDTTPYNEVFRVACHNCYDKKIVSSYASTFYEVLNKASIVEIDFYDYKNPSGGAEPRHWYVRHDLNGPESGNDNNCSGDGRGTNDLKACLGDVARWSADHPGHDVVTIYLDKKQDWGEGREPADLDNLIAQVIPASKIYKPGDLQGSSPYLRQAVVARGWPMMSALRGKIMFVLTGGTSDHHNRTQSDYVAKRGRDALIFVAPDTDETSDVSCAPNEFSEETAEYVVFYNIRNGLANQAKITSLIQSKKYVSRVWNADLTAVCSFADQCANFPAYNNLNAVCGANAVWRLVWVGK